MTTQKPARRLFEVVGENPQARLSPYCWRSRMALAHKGLPFEPEPWHVTQKDRIAKSGGITAPVLVDGEHWLRDSWQIAEYLEDSYPAHPLFPGPGNRAKALLVNHWADTVLHPQIFRAVIAQQFPLTANVDKAYYRERTQTKFGQSVDAIGADPEPARKKVAQALAPLAQTLESSPFLGGDAPDYGDYIVFGTFQWARVVSTARFWDDGNVLDRWFGALLDRFDGMGRAQKPRAAL